MINNCNFCGKEFESNKKRKFCCNQCKFESMKKQVIKKCETCGNEYSIKQSHSERSKYCSSKCQHEAFKDKFSGKNNGNYKDGNKKEFRGDNWLEMKEYIINKQNNICQMCGTDNPGKTKKKMTVHHIIPYEYFNGDYIKANNENNLNCVCLSCHFKIHQKLKKMIIDSNSNPQEIFNYIKSILTQD